MEKINFSTDSIESYAAIDRVEGKYAVLEIESCSIAHNSSIPFTKRDTFMADVLTSTITDAIGPIYEGDVIVVTHNNTESSVHAVRLAEDERDRRINFLKKLL